MKALLVLVLLGGAAVAGQTQAVVGGKSDRDAFWIADNDCPRVVSEDFDGWVLCEDARGHLIFSEDKAGKIKQDIDLTALSEAMPMDVPALYTESEKHSYSRTFDRVYFPAYFKKLMEACINSGGVVDGDDCIFTELPHWTCAEKSRILLTAEDGTKHCIKFPAAPEPAKAVSDCGPPDNCDLYHAPQDGKFYIVPVRPVPVKP